MNILIVGNGFDLSHYLPTKYDHFMLVMKAIEKKDLEKPINDVLYSPFEHPIHLITKYFEISRALDQKSYQMNFDHLFSQFKQSRDIGFISNTKKNYDVSNVYLTEIQILEIQSKLNKNGWYQYFKNHVEEIKTWIDFEQKIEEVLIVLARCIIEISSFHEELKVKRYLNNANKDDLNVRKKDLAVLNFFNFTVVNKAAIQQPISLNKIFCHGEKIENGFSSSYFVTYIQQHLEEFIEIFNLYLELIINQLIPAHKFSIESKEWINPDQIYSFNYTNTYQRIHKNIEVDYLHGSSVEKQNIVLGVSDLSDESLEKIKAYGFTKYHQKLFKDTDYLFLDSFKIRISEHRRKMESFEREYDERYKKGVRSSIEMDGLLNLKITIWGHSLDYSDKDYILDLFSLNDDIDRNVRVTVYYFDKLAKFILLNNLLAILGKDKVEHWMKNKWLQFKPNPEIKFTEAIL